MDHPFETGKEYRNRSGTYEVLAIEEPKMAIRYEDGRKALVTIATQARIWQAMKDEASSAVQQAAPRTGKKQGRQHAPVKNKQEELIAEILQDDEAILEILRRLVIPPGQINTYRLLVRSPDDFFTMQEIADETRGSDRQSLQSVFRAFGNRISNSPDERVKSLKPYNSLFFERRSSSGKMQYRLRQRVVEIFEGYPKWYDFLINEDRPWLAEDWGSEHWENTNEVYRRQMAYFGFDRERDE